MSLGQRGLSVVEVLVATVIIGIGLVGLMVVVPISSYGIQEGNQLSIATFLAEQRLEQVRNAPWGLTPANDCVGRSASATAAPTVPGGVTCTLGSTTLPAGAVTFPDESSVTGHAGYGRTVRVTDQIGFVCPENPVQICLREVRVTVSYRPMTGVGVGGASTSKAIVLVTQVARRG